MVLRAQKTKQSVQLLLRGINTINPEFGKHIDWSALLTTMVENLHTCHISNMSRLVYSSMLWTLELYQRGKFKRTCMPLSAAKFMNLLPAESISKEAKITMKEWAEQYRPVRQRTFRSETTSDKAGALPPAVYEKAKPGRWNELSFPDLQPLPFLMNLYFCLRHLTVRLSLFSVAGKFAKSSSPLSLNLLRWMNLKVTRTVTMMKQNQRRL